jgi:uncharacterized protein involved in tellurium resistance
MGISNMGMDLEKRFPKKNVSKKNLSKKKRDNLNLQRGDKIAVLMRKDKIFNRRRIDWLSSFVGKNKHQTY